MNSDVNLLQSLVHNQLSSPRYINIFKQGSSKVIILIRKLKNFIILLSLASEVQPHCEIPGCKNVAIIRRS